jgi:hypothetical protein
MDMEEGHEEDERRWGGAVVGGRVVDPYTLYRCGPAACWNRGSTYRQLI